MDRREKKVVARRSPPLGRREEEGGGGGHQHSLCRVKRQPCSAAEEAIGLSDEGTYIAQEAESCDIHSKASSNKQEQSCHAVSYV